MLYIIFPRYGDWWSTQNHPQQASHPHLNIIIIIITFLTLSCNVHHMRERENLMFNMRCCLWQIRLRMNFRQPRLNILTFLFNIICILIILTFVLQRAPYERDMYYIYIIKAFPAISGRRQRFNYVCIIHIVMLVRTRNL